MEGNAIHNVLHLSGRVLGVSKEIIKIINEYNLDNNLLSVYICDVLEFISKNCIICCEKIESDNICTVAEGVSLSYQQTRVILNFAQEKNLLEVKNGVMQITEDGKVFLALDNNTAAALIIEYFWEKADWKKLAYARGEDYFSLYEARRYVALLFLHFDKKPLIADDLMEKYMDLDVVLKNRDCDCQRMIKSETILFIIKYIFQPMGMVKLLEDFENHLFILSEGAKRIFQFYSHSIIEEYKSLMEECWESYDRGNFQEAYDMAVNILKVDSYNFQALNVLGCIYIKKKEYGEARKIFYFTIELYKKYNLVNTIDNMFKIELYLSAYFNLGLSYFYSGDFINALHVMAYIRNNVPFFLENVEELIRTIKRIIII